ncbi:hypothetical protein [Evtepia sp.]
MYPCRSAQAHSVSGVTEASAQVARTMAMAVGPQPEAAMVVFSPAAE